MRHQFLYGRKNAGYCQLNQSYFSAAPNDLMQLETLQNYILADGVDLENLPLEYYVYTDVISGERVWIEGLTSFVPGGTSTESGSRDTSMIHKYIYSGEDYESHIRAETEGEMRRFFRTVEDYQQGEGEDIESQQGIVDFVAFQEKFGFDEEQLADFIICCLDAFPRPEKRVYCYLPSADRNGSMYAKILMETLMNVLPPCVNVGAGFITYSSSFHNASVNPIHGNISVIFIPDTFENRQREISERGKSYIFDFKKYEKQNKLKHYEYIMYMINAVINDMKLGYKHETLSIYDKLIDFVKNDVAVSAEFLGYFCLHGQFKHLIKRAEDGEEKFCCTIAGIIGKLLEFEQTLTEAGKKEITQEVENLMHYCRYKEADLKWVDHIYKSGELCRNEIIYCLCDACLRFAEEALHNNQEILTITNFEYTDVNLNDHILSIIYSEEKYFLVGQRLICEMLNPLKNDSGKTATKKRTLLFSSVSGLYKTYPKFVTSKYFAEEITAFLTDFMHKADDMQEQMTAICEAIEKMDKSLQVAYYPVLQELSYLVVQDFASSLQYQPAEESALMYCTNLINQYDLDTYEKGKKTKVSCVGVLKKEILENQFTHAFASREVKEVLSVFRQSSMEDAVSFCRAHYYEVDGYLWRCEYGERQNDFSDWKELLLYFCGVGDNHVTEQCLTIIMKKENLTEVIQFYKKLQQKIGEKECEKAKKVFRKVIEQYRDSWHGQTLFASDKAFLIEMEVSGILKYNEEMTHNDEETSRKKNSYAGVTSGYVRREERLEKNRHGNDNHLKYGSPKEFKSVPEQKKFSKSETGKSTIKSEMLKQVDDVRFSNSPKEYSEIPSREGYEEEDENKKNILGRMKNKFFIKKK